MSNSNKINEIFTEKLFPIGLIFVIDIFLTGVSFVLSYSVCHYFFPNIERHKILWQLPIIIAITSLIFLFIGVYKGFVRYSRPRQVYSILNAICLANILTIIFAVINGEILLEEKLVIPLSIIIVHSVISFITLGLCRYVYHYIHNYVKNKFLGYTTVDLIYENEKNRDDLERMIHFLDASGKKVTKKIGFQKGELEKSIGGYDSDDFQADEIVLFLKSMEVNKIWGILGHIAKYRKKIVIVQELPISKRSEYDTTEYKMHNLNLLHLFPDQLSLGDEIIKIRKEIQSKTLLITGAGGTIATEFLQRLSDSNINCKLILLDNSEKALNAVSTFCESIPNFKVVSKLGDVKDAKFVESIFQKHHPNLVLHAAGNNRPEFLDNDLDIVFRENVVATKQIADFSKKYKVERFVFCSSVEAKLPKSTLEVSKRLSELYIDSMDKSRSSTRFISIRLNKIFDSDSSFVSYLKAQLNFGRSINHLDFDAYKIFSNKRDVANTIMLLLADYQGLSGILQSNLGLKIETKVLVDLLMSFNQYPYPKTFQQSLHSSIKNGWNPSSGNGFLEHSSLKMPPFKKVDTLDKFSQNEIQQKIESLCFNIMLRSGSYDEVFDLISSFKEGPWSEMYKEHTSKRNSKKIFKLN